MRKFLITVLALCFGLAVNAQNVSDLIISEVLAQPDSTGILDGYGRQLGWIELYNKSTGTVNYAGCYLTDDSSNLIKSIIPKSDNRTKLGPRQVVIFFCSGNGEDGTFYANFTLEPGKTVYLVSNDGRTIIDSLSIPTALPAGMSVSKVADDIRQQEWEVISEPTVPSPQIVNGNTSSASRGDLMKERDPHGWILSITSVSVVFSALALLWFLFWLLFDRRAKKEDSSASLRMTEKKKNAVMPSGGETSDEVAAAIALALDLEQDGDVYAAIATAVHLYLADQVHDIESGIITISRKDSIWKNKALTFRQLPR